jgi:hypothetical protein
MIEFMKIKSEPRRLMARAETLLQEDCRSGTDVCAHDCLVTTWSGIKKRHQKTDAVKMKVAARPEI